MNSKLLTISLGMVVVIASLLVMPLGLSEGLVQTDNGTINFRVDILMDTTISMPSPICETASSTVSETLEFQPGIDGLDSVNARSIDGCGDGTYGDYNITNDGNVAIDLNFKLQNALEQGITIAVGNAFDYGVSYINLTTSDYNPTWANELAATGVDTAQVWQRIGADETASGNSSFTNTIIITSFKD